MEPVLLGEIVVCYGDVSAASTQVVLWVLIWTCAMLLALCVTVGLEVRTTLGTW